MYIMEFIVDDGVIKPEMKRKAIVSDIVKMIKDNVPDLEKKKMDVGFLNIILNNLENSVKPKYNLDKKDILEEIFKACFDKITDDELAIVDKNSQFLRANNQIIKYGKVYKVWMRFKRYFY